ncbi:MAG: hypothetical protein KDB58_12370 [Solirubrobacterales bacterium]|nr:hypothetical protein [Solirubrobacterales bacterium]
MARRTRTTGSLAGQLLIGLTTLLALAAPLVALSNPELPDRGVAAAVSFLIVAAPLGVGIYARRFERSHRFGTQLVLLGVGLFVATFSNSDSSLLYSIGRMAAWVMEVAIIYVLCAYPSGRLTQRSERLTVFAALLVVVLLYFSTVPFADFPSPSTWSTCDQSCPPSYFAGADDHAFVSDVIQPLRAVLATLVFLAAGIVLARRVKQASPLARTSLTPVLGFAVVRFVSEGVFSVVRTIDASVASLVFFLTMIALTIPLIAFGFLVGLLRWRLRTARALEGLNGQLDRTGDAASLQRVLRHCLEDPSMELYLRARDDEDHWLDVYGRVVEPVAGSRRSLCAIDIEGETQAQVSCDPSVYEQPALIDGMRDAIGSYLDHERLTSELKRTLAEVDASRTRIAAAADATRRQIERDLHDGTQQRLIALRIRLELIEAEVAAHPERAQAMLQEIVPQVETVISEVRDLSRGIYPPLLTDAGPAAALRGIATGLPIETRVSGEIDRRDREVEAAIYFCCLEAVQNAIKHGRQLSLITIDIEDGESISFEVLDDGGGFDSEDGDANGSGITNMRDRLATVGGTLTVARSNGGTSVRGVIAG